jgi:hypothetical protein
MCVQWLAGLRAVAENPWLIAFIRTWYYLAILVGLIVLYGKGDFSTPPFIYQGF